MAGGKGFVTGFGIGALAGVTSAAALAGILALASLSDGPGAALAVGLIFGFYGSLVGAVVGAVIGGVAGLALAITGSHRHAKVVAAVLGPTPVAAYMSLIILEADASDLAFGLLAVAAFAAIGWIAGGLFLQVMSSENAKDRTRPPATWPPLTDGRRVDDLPPAPWAGTVLAADQSDPRSLGRPVNT